MEERIKWTGKTDEDVNLCDVFILADRIHQWIAENQAHTEMNYLSLVCTSGVRTDEKWAASFDSMACDAEWFESIENLSFAAYGACPEEAMYRAALKAKNYIEDLDRELRLKVQVKEGEL
jgi:hypothetical protein